jgi:hypothetical protein
VFEQKERFDSTVESEIEQEKGGGGWLWRPSLCNCYGVTLKDKNNNRVAQRLVGHAWYGRDARLSNPEVNFLCWPTSRSSHRLQYVPNIPCPSDQDVLPQWRGGVAAAIGGRTATTHARVLRKLSYFGIIVGGSVGVRLRWCMDVFEEIHCRGDPPPVDGSGALASAGRNPMPQNTTL